MRNISEYGIISLSVPVSAVAKTTLQEIMDYAGEFARHVIHTFGQYHMADIVVYSNQIKENGEVNSSAVSTGFELTPEISVETILYRGNKPNTIKYKPINLNTLNSTGATYELIRIDIYVNKIPYLIGQGVNIKSGRSNVNLKVANKKWYVINTTNVKNCGYSSVYTAMFHRSYPILLSTKTEGNDARIKKGYEMKKILFAYAEANFPDVVMSKDHVDDMMLYLMAQYYQVNIHIMGSDYNPRFDDPVNQRPKIFSPGSNETTCRMLNEKVSNDIYIRHTTQNNKMHFEALIPRHQLEEGMKSKISQLSVLCHAIIDSENKILNEQEQKTIEDAKKLVAEEENDETLKLEKRITNITKVDFKKLIEDEYEYDLDPDTKVDNYTGKIVEAYSKESRKIRTVKVAKYEDVVYGAYDIETCISKKAIESEKQKGINSDEIVIRDQKAYMIGYTWGKTLEESETNLKIFKGLDCITQFFASLKIESEKLRVEGKRLLLFGHNAGKFDITFLLNNETQTQFRITTNSSLYSNGRWISLTLESDMTIPGTNKTELNKIKFGDSYALLTGSLASLCKSFKVKYQKKGDVKHFKIYQETFEEDDITYNITEYLKYDVLGLMEVMLKFADKVENHSSDGKTKDFGISLYDTPTASSIGSKTFFSKFYDHNKTPIYTLPKEIYEYIKPSYHGGRTECFHIGKVGRC